MQHSKQCSSCSYLGCANKVGLFFIILFALCFFWYFIHPVEQELHLSSLKLAFFGYTGMDVKSFILGAIQVYIWGYIAVGAWRIVSCHNCGSCCCDTSKK